MMWSPAVFRFPPLRAVRSPLTTTELFRNLGCSLLSSLSALLKIALSDAKKKALAVVSMSWVVSSIISDSTSTSVIVDDSDFCHPSFVVKEKIVWLGTEPKMLFDSEGYTPTSVMPCLTSDGTSAVKMICFSPSITFVVLDMIGNLSTSKSRLALAE